MLRIPSKSMQRLVSRTGVFWGPALCAWRPRHLAAHVVLLLILVPIPRIGFEAIAMPPDSPFRNFAWQKLFRSVESSFDTGALLYVVLVLLEHAMVYYQRYQASAIQASQLQTQLVQPQLQALKMEIRQATQGGMGLRITRGRLESLYGAHQSLVLRNLAEGGVEAKVTIPLHTGLERTEEDHDAELQSIAR